MEPLKSILSGSYILSILWMTQGNKNQKATGIKNRVLGSTPVCRMGKVKKRREADNLIVDASGKMTCHPGTMVLEKDHERLYKESV